MKWLERVDAVLWLAGALLAIGGVVDGLHTGRSLKGMLRSTWGYSSGGFFILGGVVLIAIVFRWRASRAEADLFRKYPRRTR
jgi:hypothetical protein